MALISSPDGGGSVHFIPQSVFPFLDSVHDVVLRGELVYGGERQGNFPPVVHVLYHATLTGCPRYPMNASSGELEEARCVRKFQGFLQVGDFKYGLNSRALVDFVSDEEVAKLQSRPHRTHADIFQSETVLKDFLSDKTRFLAGVTYAFVDGQYRQSFWWDGSTNNPDASQMQEGFIDDFFAGLNENRYNVPCKSSALESVDAVRKTLEPSLSQLLSSVVQRPYSSVERDLLCFAVESVYENFFERIVKRESIV